MKEIQPPAPPVNAAERIPRKSESSPPLKHGEHAKLVTYSAVFGRKEQQLRKFEIGEVEKYAQYDASVAIKGLSPGKRKWWFLQIVPNNLMYAVIYDRNNAPLYDSRGDVPCDMEKWSAAKAEMAQRGFA